MPMTTEELERLRARAALLRSLHQEIFDEVSGVLYHRDPAKIGITTDYHDYEVYDPHTGMILPRLLEAGSPEHLAELIHKEFLLWYGDQMAGPVENYKWIAQDIWDAWQAYKATQGEVSFELAKPAAADVTVRKATFGDIDELVRLRLALLREDGELPEDAVSQMNQATKEYFSWALPTGQFHAWVAEVSGAIVGMSGLIVLQRPPYPGNVSGKEVYLLNQYTMPEHRNQGIAGAIVKEVIDAARGLGVGRIFLDATHAAEGVYRVAGFRHVGKGKPREDLIAMELML